MEPRPPLPTDLRLKLDGELLPGERLLWAAQPRGRRMLGSFAIWLFAIPWTAFSLFWETMALGPWWSGDRPAGLVEHGFGIVMPLFGAPFVLIGVAMMIAPFLALRAAGRTAHALTDRRLITLTAGRRAKVKSVMIGRIGPVERSEGRDGWGSIKVQTHSRIDGEGDRITEKFEMDGIPDVARLEKLILEQQPR